MSKKTKNAYLHDKLLFNFVGENCPDMFLSQDYNDLKEEYENFRNSLDEINMMILYAQEIGDSKEVAQWRRMLMRNKMMMREIKEKMKNMTDAKHMEKEIVYS